MIHRFVFSSLLLALASSLSFAQLQCKKTILRNVTDKGLISNSNSTTTVGNADFVDFISISDDPYMSDEDYKQARLGIISEVLGMKVDVRFLDLNEYTFPKPTLMNDSLTYYIGRGIKGERGGSEGSDYLLTPMGELILYSYKIKGRAGSKNARYIITNVLVTDDYYAANKINSVKKYHLGSVKVEGEFKVTCRGSRILTDSQMLH